MVGQPTARASAQPPCCSRREFIRAGSALAVYAALARLTPAWAQGSGVAERGGASQAAASDAAGERGTTVVKLTVERTKLPIGDKVGRPVTLNRTLPGPLLRFREGDEVELRVTNRLTDRASIHWHGILLPNPMDGVPGVTFKGIDPGETFVYRFPIKQYGTYWYHSHSGFQEQLGMYGPMVIDPAAPEPFTYSREHVVVLSDWTFEEPKHLFAKLKKVSNFSNMQRQTLVELYELGKQEGFGRALADWASWAKMRMDPTDVADLTGAFFTFLINGRPAISPWTGQFRPGERVRLRLINTAATTHYDVRIPGLSMTVVQADGQHVRPVEVEELRMGVAETYDVLVTPAEERAYALFAETTDRSGYALGVLAPREGMLPPLPPRRKRPLLTMADMGMGHAGHSRGEEGASGGEHGQHGSSATSEMGAGTRGAADAHAGHSGMQMEMPPPEVAGGHEGHGEAHEPPPTVRGEKAAPQDGSMAMSGHDGEPMGGSGEMQMPKNDFGPGNSMTVMSPSSRTDEPGLGLGKDGWRVLVYRDLVAHDPRPLPEPAREIVMNVTGNMERFVWGFDGKKYSESEPVRLRYGERVRVTFINQTMMEHPLHLHGMFMELENGANGIPPLKHTIVVKPAEKLSVLVTADAPGDWAFHCHLQYHMEAGMFRVFSVA